MRERLRRLLPTQERLAGNRWLRWLGPVLYEAALWRWSRRGVALGVAIGVFFGLMVPIAQIPLSAAACVVLRANVPFAMASTLVTNPFTFAPVYVAAYHLGLAVTDAMPLGEMLAGSEEAALLARITAVGAPFLVGLAIIASLSSVFCYVMISLVWVSIELLRQWRRQHRG